MKLIDENLPFALWEQIFTGKIGFGNVGKYKGIVFKFYTKEQGHNESHCHVSYQDFNISISLKSFEVLDGNLPKKRQEEAVDWVVNNIDIFKKYWNGYHEYVIA